MRFRIRGFPGPALLAICSGLLSAAPAAAQTATETAAFRRFLEADIWPAAKARGVSRATFDTALSKVKPNLALPDLVLPGETPKIE